MFSKQHLKQRLQRRFSPVKATRTAYDIAAPSAIVWLTLFFSRNRGRSASIVMARVAGSGFLTKVSTRHSAEILTSELLSNPLREGQVIRLMSNSSLYTRDPCTDDIGMHKYLKSSFWQSYLLSSDAKFYELYTTHLRKAMSVSEPRSKSHWSTFSGLRCTAV